MAVPPWLLLPLRSFTGVHSVGISATCGATKCRAQSPVSTPNSVLPGSNRILQFWSTAKWVTKRTGINLAGSFKPILGTLTAVWKFPRKCRRQKFRKNERASCRKLHKVTCLSARFHHQGSNLDYNFGDTLGNPTICYSQSSPAQVLRKHVNNRHIGLKQGVCNEMPTYSVDISKGFIRKDFILSEEEFCAQVTSKL